MLASDVITRVKEQFGDEAGIQITDSMIIRWINDGIKDISYNSNLLQTRATADVVAGQSEYDLPADILSVHNVRYDGVVLRGLSIQEADALYPDHDNTTVQATTGIPQNYWIYAQTLFLYPTPDTDGTAKLRMYYTKLATEIANSGDTLPLPPQFDNAIVAYCLKKAYEKDENWEAAQLQGSQYTSTVSTIQEDVSFTHRDEYPSISVSDRDGTYGEF